MTLRADRVVVAGDTVVLSGVAAGLTGGLVRCTIKHYLNHGDAAAVAEVDSLDGGVIVTGDTGFACSFGPGVTEDWPIGLLWYDVQLVNGDDEVYTLARGALTTLRRITRARTVPGTHAPLSAATGALTLTGADASFTRGLAMQAEGGSLTLAGGDASFYRGLALVADAGALVLTGADVTIAAQRRLTADAGALVLTGADVTLTYAVSLSAIIAALGSRLHFWFEVGVSTETLNSGNFAQLNDSGPGGYHAVQATAGSQPEKITSGGPNNKPYLNCQGTTRRIVNTSIGLSADRALSYFAVSKVTAASALRVACGTREGTSESVGDMNFAAGNSATNTPLKIVKHQGGAEQNITVTSPAGDTNWHLWWQEYASGAAAVTKIDTTTTTPAPTGTGKSVALQTIVFGHPTVAGGSTYLFGCIEGKTASDEAMIRSYVAYQTGIVT